MSTLPKFMFLQDHTISEDLIIHTQAPMIIGQVVHGDVHELIKEYKPMAVGKLLDSYNWAVFYSGMLSGFEFTGTTQEYADLIAKIMREMSDYYFEYLQLKGQIEN